MHDFRSINEVFKKDEALANIRIFVKQSDIVSLFGSLFPDLKNIASAVKLEKEILFLRVENSVWRSELKFHQKIIVERINDHYGEIVVKSVKFLA
ncbi:MAG: DUF721 domain-containing protein [Ignavibacteriales bacterium]|nr:DUF721 domain-containing protein [Ignavibacteriales bacterium]